MNSRYESYSETKESGVQWLGVIPRHWGVIESKRLFAQRKERLRLGDEHLTASQKYGVIPQTEFMRLEDQKVMQVFTGAEILKHVEPNDFVISMRSFQGGLEWCGYSGCVSSAYVGITPIKNVKPSFFKYLFKCFPYIQALQSTSNLVRDGQALRFQNFIQVPLPFVPEAEQSQIAKFLDYETAKIDALIEKQQQLIAMLKEKRQAVISHAVTKGLNPDAPMRDSGVEWLGEVPAHWTVAPLKRFIVLQRGHDLPAGSRREGGYPVVSSAGPISTHDDYRCKGPGIVTGRYGTIGEFHYVATDFWPLNTALYSISCHGNSERFLLYMLRNMKHLFVLNSLKAAVPGVDRNDLHCEYVAAPSNPQEQELIANYLDDRMSRFDELSAKTKEGILLLQERRTALISNAVTGKIDVRDWKAPESETAMEVA